MGIIENQIAPSRTESEFVTLDFSQQRYEFFSRTFSTQNNFAQKGGKIYIVCSAFDCLHFKSNPVNLSRVQVVRQPEPCSNNSYIFISFIFAAIMSAWQASDGLHQHAKSLPFNSFRKAGSSASLSSSHFPYNLNAVARSYSFRLYGFPHRVLLSTHRALAGIFQPLVRFFWILIFITL
jgi:hypothetical protein